MSRLDKVFKRIDGYRDEIIRLQDELTSKTALGPENGGSGEHEKAAYLKKLIEDLKPDMFQEIQAPDERAQDGYRPNLVSRWDGEKQGPTVWALSHMDIVPPGDLALWKSDPYKIKIEDDRIIGRGVEDNQHGIVSSYIALKAIFESGENNRLPVGLAMVADEETGSKFGLDYLLKNHGELFTAEDLIIVPDGGNGNGTMIEVAEKSMLWIKFTVTGRQCHASTPDKGNNSMYGAASLILTLREVKEAFGQKDELFKPSMSTFESTKREANVPNINTIPGKDVFYMDCRILPYYQVDDIINFIMGIAEETAKEWKLAIEVEPVLRQEATNPTSADAHVVKALEKAINRVIGLEAKPMGIGGGTVAAFFRQAGFPAAVWMTAPDSAHQPNEYCLISSIIQDAKVFACLYMGEEV